MSEDYCDLCDLPLSTCVHGMPAPPPAARTAAPAAAPTRRAPRRWTPPEHFAPLVVEVLREAGGELDAEEVFTRLEERVADDLLEGDHGRTPEGELRWRYAVRRARQSMLADGTMQKDRPGVWRLGPSAG